jgi:amino acid permease
VTRPLVVQYIIGVGVLGVPKAFFDAGWALSLLILLAVTVVSYMSMVWLLEVRPCARPASA